MADSRRAQVDAAQWSSGLTGIQISFSNFCNNKIYIAEQQKCLTTGMAMAQSEPCWVSLQTSAHILQNLLLWWNFSATLRGCAFFCKNIAATQQNNKKLNWVLQLPLLEAMCIPRQWRHRGRNPLPAADARPICAAGCWQRTVFADVPAGRLRQVLWYTHLLLHFEVVFGLVVSARSSCAGQKSRPTSCARYAPDSRFTQSCVY